MSTTFYALRFFVKFSKKNTAKNTTKAGNAPQLLRFFLQFFCNNYRLYIIFSLIRRNQTGWAEKQIVKFRSILQLRMENGPQCLPARPAH